jgi:hypothetical protein
MLSRLAYKIILFFSPGLADGWSSQDLNNIYAWNFLAMSLIVKQ